MWVPEILTKVLRTVQKTFYLLSHPTAQDAYYWNVTSGQASISTTPNLVHSTVNLLEHYDPDSLSTLHWEPRPQNKDFYTLTLEFHKRGTILGRHPPPFFLPFLPLPPSFLLLLFIFPLLFVSFFRDRILHRSPCLSLRFHHLKILKHSSVVLQGCDPSALEAEAEKSCIWSQSWVPSEFQANLGYTLRPCLTTLSMKINIFF